MGTEYNYTMALLGVVPTEYCYSISIKFTHQRRSRHICKLELARAVSSAVQVSMASSLSLIFLLLTTTSLFSESVQQNLPAIISPAVLSGGGTASCPSDDSLNSLRQSVTAETTAALVNVTFETINNCSCGADWTNIAYLDYSDPTVACPSTLTAFTGSGVSGCKRPTNAPGRCDTITFPSGGRSYSRVCGRVNAYQKGNTDGFEFGARPQPNLEGNYVDGVSLTHGAPGSRQHIWTFAAALTAIAMPAWTPFKCDCINTQEAWPHTVPSFIGNNLFCATGNEEGPVQAAGVVDTVYADNPLWDGEGCGPTNTCCEFNNPPWFCTTLPQPTTDGIELRVCNNQLEQEEDVILSFVNINIAP